MWLRCSGWLSNITITMSAPCGLERRLYRAKAFKSNPTPYTFTIMTENKINQLRQKIQDRIKELNVQTRHSDDGHFYFVPEFGETFGSVTGLQYIIKDPSIELFMKNEALRYIRGNFHLMNGGNLDEHLFHAGQASIVARDNAGGWGTTIHNLREEYFMDWILTGQKPQFTVESLAKRDPMADPKVISGAAGIDKFLQETGYIPLGCEIMVYSKKWKVAGMLDDVGLLPRKVEIPGTDGGYKVQHDIVLMDLKTSNQFKDFYHVQVAAYYKMFKDLFKITPQRCFILKAGKEHRDYKIEWIDDVKTPIGAVDSLVKLGEELKTINKAREPKVVSI